MLFSKPIPKHTTNEQKEINPPKPVSNNSDRIINTLNIVKKKDIFSSTKNIRQSDYGKNTLTPDYSSKPICQFIKNHFGNLFHKSIIKGS